MVWPLNQSLNFGMNHHMSVMIAYTRNIAAKTQQEWLLYFVGRLSRQTLGGSHILYFSEFRPSLKKS